MKNLLTYLILFIVAGCGINKTNSAEDFYYEGIERLDDKEFEEAISFFKKSLELDNKSPTTLNNLGYAFHKIGNYKKAIEYYSLAIDEKSNNPSFYNNRGISKAEIKDYQGAILDYEQAIHISKTKNASFYNNLGFSLWKIKDYDEATISFLEAYRIDKKLSQPLANLAEMNLELGDCKNVKKYCKEFIQLHGKSEKANRIINQCDSYNRK